MLGPLTIGDYSMVAGKKDKISDVREVLQISLQWLGICKGDTTDQATGEEIKVKKDNHSITDLRRPESPFPSRKQMVRPIPHLLSFSIISG